MKIKDMIVSAIFKKGILYEGRNIDTVVEIPTEHEGTTKVIKIHIKADHMSLRFEKTET